MKHIIPKASTKQILIAILLIMISLIIWFNDPLFRIANLQPIPTEKRFYLIASLFLAWILIIITAPYIKKYRASDKPLSSEDIKKCQLLEGHFQNALLFLKKTFINKNSINTNLLKLPWCLLIGPSHAGKTTLLAHANISYLSGNQSHHQSINHHDMGEFWVTQDLVILDVPGIYLESEKFLWEHIIHLVKKHHQSKPLHAVAIALPLPDLLTIDHSQQKNTFIEDIQKNMIYLQHVFSKKLNFYFIITKCDQIPGFLEFFNESSAEESAQAWGITFPMRKDNNNLSDIFSRRFDTLIKRLNNQLIWRLHQERNTTMRPAIKDFPLYMERLKKCMHYFLKSLSTEALELQGVYLTSAIQPGIDHSTHSNVIHHPHTQMALPSLRQAVMLTKPYFIRQLVMQGLLSTASYASTTILQHPWRNYIIYATSITTTITAIVLLGYDFQKNLLRTYAIHNDILQYQLALQRGDSIGDPILKAIPLLNELESAVSLHTSDNLSSYFSYYSDKSRKTATTIYQQSLQSLFLAEIKNTFETYLHNTSNNNPTRSYAILKAYLMLRDPNHLNPAFITHTLEELLSSKLTKSTRHDLFNHLNMAIKEQTQPLLLNKALIETTRNQLMVLPQLELAQVILKNMDHYNHEKDIRFDANTINPVITSDFVIPACYTAAAFQTIYTRDIFTAATEALQGNWVIGTPTLFSKDPMMNALAQQLRASYLTSYIETWENSLTHLKLTEPTQLKQIDATLGNLTSNTSPLLQTLQVIKTNTAIPPIMAKSQKLQSINTLLTNTNTNQDNLLYQVFVNLRDLHYYLQPFLSTPHVSQAAFDAATTRIQGNEEEEDPITALFLFAEKTPEPIKTWLNQLAKQSWHFILQETSQYIENAWQVNILTIYHSQIADLSPLNPKAEKTINIQQFVNFVEKQGTLATFYHRFLKPFVNDTSKTWQWLVIDDQKLSFSHAALIQIQEAMKLQNLSKYALFSLGQNHLALQRFQLPEKLEEQE